MSQNLRATTEKELEAFLFQKAHLRYRIGAPILAMRDDAGERGEIRRVPTRFWVITVFAVDADEQAISGRSVDLFVYADTVPGVPALLALFWAYPEALRQVWDARHARCYGFSTWDAQYGDEYKYIEEAQTRHEECKAIVRHMRLLLGSRLFSVFRAMDL